MPTRLRHVATIAIATLWMGCAAAQPGTASAPDAAPVVFTKARVTSWYEASDRKRYVRLKLMPRTKLPFTTQTFRVTDRAMGADIEEGSWVRFTAKSIDGENTVTAMQAIPACKRFQACD